MPSDHDKSPIPPEPEKPGLSGGKLSNYYPQILEARGNLRLAKKRHRRQQQWGAKILLLIVMLIGLLLILQEIIKFYIAEKESEIITATNLELSEKLGFHSYPLAMEGGDPYIRALMRTISASESNSLTPYNLMYGGETFSDLSHHPNRCVTIVVGPNRGKCTTAAGRYQFLTTTWLDMAGRYYPNPNGFAMWRTYSFEPKYQDLVVYTWLRDGKFWKKNIPRLLRDGKISEVLQMLSVTWTSLGYGIENNTMSSRLPQVYQIILEAELQEKGADQFTGEQTEVIIEYFPKPQDGDRVEQALRKIKYQLIVQPTIVANQPTNAIWFGSQVKLEDVKLVAETLISSGIEIKAIKPFQQETEFTRLRIQVGAESQFANQPPLKLEQVQLSTEFR